MLLSATGAHAQVAAEAGRVAFEIDLPRQRAADAIAELARRTGTQILARADAVRGIRTQAVRGRYTADEALRLLLRGTGLVARPPQDGSGIIVIERSAEAVAIAGDEEPPADADIVVTGSNIAGGEITSPVTVITAQDIARSGFTTPDQLVRSMTQAGTSSNAAGFGGVAASLNTAQAFGGPTGRLGQVPNEFSAGSGINLRGLGEGATLILVNGRRMAAAGSSGGGSTDISGIPLNAIERIEILPNSASAIYGADAVAGVVNIILKRDYSGIEATVRHGLSSTLADDTLLSMNVGHNWSGGNLLLTGSYRLDQPVATRKIDTLFGDQRPRGGADWRTDRCLFGEPGDLPVVILPRQSAALPRQCLYGPAGSGVGLTRADFFTQPADPEARRYTDFVPPELTPRTELLSFTGAFSQTLTETWSVNMTGLWSRRHSSSRIPTYIQANIPAANPFNPFGRPAALITDFRNEIAAGLLPDTTQAATFTSLGGTIDVSGTLFGSWRGSVQTSFSRNVTRSWINGVDRDAVTQALADTNRATALNLFGDGSAQNPATLAALVRRRDQPRWISEERQLIALANGNLVELPMGMVKTAVGVELRRPVITRTVRAPAGTANAGALIADGVYSRGQRALFGEAQIPLVSRGMVGPGLEALTLTLAGRHEWYDAIGPVPRANAFTERVGLAWDVFRFLALNGQYSTSFRVPNNQSLFAPQVAIPVARVQDPRRGGQTVTYASRTGGNPDLDNETGTSWSGGGTLRLFGDRLTGSVNYWQTDYDNLVFSPRAQDFIRLEAFFPAFFRRAAPLPGETVGALEFIDLLPINLARFTSRGLDFQLNSRVETRDAGTFSLNVQATEIIAQDRRILPDTPVERLRGNALFGAPFSARGVLNWTRSMVSATTAVNYKGPTTNPLGFAVVTRVAPLTTFDMQVAIRFDERVPGLNGMTFSVGATNLFDARSPFLDSELGVDFNKWDPRGRVAYIALTKSFD